MREIDREELFQLFKLGTAWVARSGYGVVPLNPRYLRDTSDLVNGAPVHMQGLVRLRADGTRDTYLPETLLPAVEPVDVFERRAPAFATQPVYSGTILEAAGFVREAVAAGWPPPLIRMRDLLLSPEDVIALANSAPLSK